MVIIKNIKQSGTYASCDYFPDGNDQEKGHIVVDTEQKEIVEHDREPSMASRHAKNLLLDVVKSGEISGEHIRMWY